MNLLPHLFRKDLRFSRWMMLATLLVAAGALCFPIIPLDDRANHIVWLGVPRYGAWVLLFLTIARLVLLDPPVHDEGFIRTRPVPISSLLQAKCLTAMVLIVPLALIECIMLRILGLRPGAVDLLVVFCENLLVLSAIAAAGIALAVREKTFGKWLASVLRWGGVLLIAWIAVTWFQEFYQRREKPVFSYAGEYLKSSRFLMFQCVIIAGALIAIIRFVRSRHEPTISKSLVITAVCAAATWFFWPLNFVNAFVPERRTAPRSEWPDRTHLAFIAEDQRNGRDENSPLTFTNGGWNDLRYSSIRGNYSLSGLPEGWQGGHNAYESEVILENGKVLPSRQHAWAPVNMKWILPELGIDPGFKIGERPLFSVDYAEFNLAHASGAMNGAMVKGTVHIPLKRAMLLARLPFKAGVSTFVAGRRIDITRIESSEDRIEFSILAQTSIDQFRGGWQKVWTDRLDYIVINAARGEFLDQKSSGQSSPVSGHYALQYDNTSCGISPRFKPKPIPPDWLDGAELLIVGEEYGGTFSHSFDFTDVKLGNQR